MSTDDEQLLHLAAAPFEAARRVLILPPEHPSRRLHGHSFMAKLRLPAKAGDSLRGDEPEALQARLREAVAPLDYRDLNELLEVPTDENLARWLRARLDTPEGAVIGVQSTREQGADLDRRERAHVWRRFRFEAAHQLPNVAPGHQCGRMHGHGFEVILHASVDMPGEELGVDYDRLGELWAPLQARLHLACLNDIPGLENPTSEMLSGWIWAQLKPVFPALAWVSVYETATAGCHFDGERYSIWKEQRFESALRLGRLAEGDPRRALHGHSYLLRLHLSAPLDAVLGWTVDYGEVKALFKPLYAQLDHHTVSDLPGIGDEGSAGIARWVRRELSPSLPQLDRVDVFEQPGCGVALAWGAERSPILPV